mmetsp:Transcript_89913/g.169472  ORF Transcript_89913/g.169472 Transcript_89913/m.169472 type:complete len:139 (-) Transcript_89913:1819-2235(-)
MTCPDRGEMTIPHHDTLSKLPHPSHRERLVHQVEKFQPSPSAVWTFLQKFLLRPKQLETNCWRVWTDPKHLEPSCWMVQTDIPPGVGPQQSRKMQWLHTPRDSEPERAIGHLLLYLEAVPSMRRSALWVISSDIIIRR